MICMAKVQKIAEIAPNLPFSEFNFYDLFRSTFEKSELGKMKKLLPLRELAGNFRLAIFFGIHTANVVQLVDRIVQREQLEGRLKRRHAHKRCFCIGAIPLVRTVDEISDLNDRIDDKEAFFDEPNADNG